jgi:hypothetical protein
MHPLSHQESKVGLGLGLEGDCCQKVKIVLPGVVMTCSDDITTRAAGICTKGVEFATKRATEGSTLGFCLAERTGFFKGRALRTVVMV